MNKEKTKEALDALERILSYTNGLGDGEAYTIRAALTAPDVNAELLEALNTLLCCGYGTRSECGGQECFYCGGDFSNFKGDFKHTKDCPTVIAERAIARAEAQKVEED